MGPLFQESWWRDILLFLWRFFSLFSIYLNGRMMLPCQKFNNVRHAELYNTLNTSYCSCLKCLKCGDWNYTVFEATDKGKIHNFNMSVSFVVWFHCACSHAVLIVCVTNCTIRRDSGGDVSSRPRTCSTCRYGIPPIDVYLHNRKIEIT